ncbi:MAG TPA: hypothetical protein VN317_10025 [Candidatus Methanoperedens sp.]|nr:hypothetical protein [Candidatus Methanoperedens sp.]
MRTRRVIAAALLAALSLASRATPASAIVANEVTSAHIKEADGTSGQNTNAGAGIKTNHIQKDAVTSAKIKDGTVATGDLANGAVTSAKIKDGNVFTADLAGRSVTAAKVGFYRRVIVVEPNGGGDYTSPVAALNSIGDASGANPYLVKIMPGVYDVGQEAMVMKPYVDIEGSGERVTRIVGVVAGEGVLRGASNAEARFLTIENDSTEIGWNIAVYAPQGTNPSLLHVTAIAVGGQTGMKVGVHCDTGSAPTLSHVTARGFLGSATYGVYSTDAAPQLSDVEARGENGIDFNFGVYLTFSDGAVLRRVAATASGGSGQSANVGIGVVASSPVIADSTAFAYGHPSVNVGLRIEGEGRPELTNVSARGLGGNAAIGLQTLELAVGQPAAGYQVVVDRCTFEGATASVSSDTEYYVRIGASKLIGGAAVSGGGTLECSASYDGSTKPLESDCGGCKGPLGTFHMTEWAYVNVNACVDTLISKARTRCCSGLLNPSGGFVYGASPATCQGICQ